MPSCDLKQTRDTTLSYDNHSHMAPHSVPSRLNERVAVEQHDIPRAPPSRISAEPLCRARGHWAKHAQRAAQDPDECHDDDPQRSCHLFRVNTPKKIVEEDRSKNLEVMQKIELSDSRPNRCPDVRARQAGETRDMMWMDLKCEVLKDAGEHLICTGKNSESTLLSWERLWKRESWPSSLDLGDLVLRTACAMLGSHTQPRRRGTASLKYTLDLRLRS